MREAGRRRLLVGMLATAVLVPLATWGLVGPEPFGISDEGFRFLLARAWARGEGLHVGYELLYPGGQYAWFGVWMRLFGEHVQVVRCADALLSGLAAALVVWLAGAHGAPALVFSLASCVSVFHHKGWVALPAVSVLALAVSLASSDRPTRRFALGGALLAGALAGWREDSAILALGLCLVAALRRRRPFEALIIVAPGAVAGFLPWLVVAWSRGEVESVLRHTAARLGFLVTRLAEPTSVSWTLQPGQLRHAPYLLGHQALPLLAALPPTLYLGLLGWQLLRRRRGESIDRCQAVGALVGLAYLPQFLWERPDVAHLKGHLPVFLGVVAIVAGRWVVARQRRVAAALVAVALAGLATTGLRRSLRPATPYPCCEGARIGARLVGGGPPWAGLPRRPGETLIVLTWGAGWYALEGVPRGTRFLSTFRRHLSRADEAELVEDLRRAENRWVLLRRRGEMPVAVRGALIAGYRSVERWRGWELWGRGAGGSAAPGARSPTPQTSSPTGQLTPVPPSPQ